MTAVIVWFGALAILMYLGHAVEIMADEWKASFFRRERVLRRRGLSHGTWEAAA